MKVKGQKMAHNSKEPTLILNKLSLLSHKIKKAKTESPVLKSPDGPTFILDRREFFSMLPDPSGTLPLLDSDLLIEEMEPAPEKVYMLHKVKKAKKPQAARDLKKANGHHVPQTKAHGSDEPTLLLDGNILEEISTESKTKEDLKKKGLAAHTRIPLHMIQPETPVAIPLPITKPEIPAAIPSPITSKAITKPREVSTMLSMNPLSKNPNMPTMDVNSPLKKTRDAIARLKELNIPVPKPKKAKPLQAQQEQTAGNVSKTTLESVLTGREETSKPSFGAKEDSLVLVEDNPLFNWHYVSDLKQCERTDIEGKRFYAFPITISRMGLEKVSEDSGTGRNLGLVVEYAISIFYPHRNLKMRFTEPSVISRILGEPLDEEKEGRIILPFSTKRAVGLEISKPVYTLEASSARKEVEIIIDPSLLRNLRLQTQQNGRTYAGQPHYINGPLSIDFQDLAQGKYVGLPVRITKVAFEKENGSKNIPKMDVYFVPQHPSLQKESRIKFYDFETIGHLLDDFNHEEKSHFSVYDLVGKEAHVVVSSNTGRVLSLAAPKC